MNIAIICAGGNGERMKTKENKIFLQVNGKPVIYYTLKALSDYDKIDSIYITAGEEYIERLKKTISQYGINKVCSIENAFKTRQESTYHVIKKLKDMNIPQESYLLIHNAVNPFVKHSELDRCLDAARQYGASLLGFQAIDTVKIIDENCIIDHTPDRNKVWIAQTPQILRFDIAVRAFEHAYNAGFLATDDTTLVEEIHGEVKFVECSRENFKITYFQDMVLAKRIYSKRMKEKSVWYA
ncbi:MAG TPA: 2-C-methyl-D-erythritol 4-phosphate cytidylyltransferase [Spirochaetes bacterium]|nr:2-C-methyl-D-erythritol 4-phosphate cytidylyltransferase [Spirochaetota bacterium]